MSDELAVIVAAARARQRRVADMLLLNFQRSQTQVYWPAPTSRSMLDSVRVPELKDHVSIVSLP